MQMMPYLPRERAINELSVRAIHFLLILPEPCFQINSFTDFRFGYRPPTHAHTTYARSYKKQGHSKKKIYFCFIDCTKAFDCVNHNELWKILKEMGIPDRLTYLLRNLYAGQKATVRTGHGTTDWFQIGKGVRQGRILSPCLFNLYADYIMRNAGLDDA